MSLSSSKFDKKEIQAFKTFFEKGPVNRPTSQMAANTAHFKIAQYLTLEEESKLGTAWSHACFVGEGRKEWDHVCSQIKKRLKLDKII